MTSVYEDRADAPLVKALLLLHWSKRNPGEFPLVVDANWGGGLFWKGTSYPVVGMDRDPQRAKDIQADNGSLPLRDESVDVLAYDPPHIPDVGRRVRAKYMSEQYSIAWGQQDIGGSTLAFLVEAVRVLRAGGIVIAKLSDQVQTGEKHWQVVDYVHGARVVGLTPCDHVVKVRARAGPQPWGEAQQKHAWQRHSDFIVCRKGGC